MKRKNIKFVGATGQIGITSPDATDPYVDLPPPLSTEIKKCETNGPLRQGEHANFLLGQVRFDQPPSELDCLRFLKAAQLGDLRQVISLLGRGVDPNYTDSFNWTAIDCARVAKQEHIVEFLNSLQKQNMPENHQFRPRSTNSEPCRETQLDCGSSTGSEQNDDCLVPTSIPDVIDWMANHPTRSSLFNGVPDLLERGAHLLTKLGWNGISGLGSREQGQLYPIRAFRKTDRRGIGCERTTRKAVKLDAPRDFSVSRKALQEYMDLDRQRTRRLRRMLDI